MLAKITCAMGVSCSFRCARIANRFGQSSIFKIDDPCRDDFANRRFKHRIVARAFPPNVRNEVRYSPHTRDAKLFFLNRETKDERACYRGQLREGSHDIAQRRCSKTGHKKQNTASGQARRVAIALPRRRDRALVQYPVSVQDRGPADPYRNCREP